MSQQDGIKGKSIGKRTKYRKQWKKQGRIT